MPYQGQAIQVSFSDGVAQLVFNATGGSVNKFDAATVSELRAAVDVLSGLSGVSGLILSSGKGQFIVGADVTEFGGMFLQSEDEIAGYLGQVNDIFSDIEDLPFPTVTAINGTALGGGLEVCLATDFRVISTQASIGLPEVKLGIFPGFGGTVRLPRLIGADNAIEIIAGGKTIRPDAALKMGAVDAVVAPEQLMDAARDILAQADGLGWQARRAEKCAPLKLPMMEQLMCFSTAKGFIKAKAGKHYPAPVAAVSVIEAAAAMGRDDALKLEAKAFAKVAKTSVAASLVGLFLNDQLIKKKGRGFAKIAAKVDQAAVLGAGIMGGGIAYQSASKKTPIIMKDINEPAIELGMSHAQKLLTKQLDRGRIDGTKLASTLSMIRPTLSYGDFGTVDVVVEAVVENERIKKMVLAEVEAAVPETAVLASNTSSISITKLAEGLQRPERFCGMHFFNPVHRMPLVEIIRGEQSSDEAIATVAVWAERMGKTPIVVNDCPGFLVNRVLFPYLAGFQLLVRDGVDFTRIDKVMERYGWPMGPAYLLDVVGIDTAHHVSDVLAEGYPDRMSSDERSSIDVLFEADRYGQKNAKGYYSYTLDRKGKPKKSVDPEVGPMLASLQAAVPAELTDEQIIDRMMIPMIIETARCLEEGIVGTPNEADMGLIMGIGFPPFLGGALKLADSLGLATLVAKADALAHLGALYGVTQAMREQADAGATYYPTAAE
jgi:3-hydroxyacyl-CoA dehydrogenase / enoyl-CoA hydratase / 3-hydroxybutyryl-CoA epimerase / enoyl-CoA isomerase